MRRFLIVDDNAALAENLAEIIADSGLGEAVLAGSGRDALGLAAESRFDVLISDVRMPEMDGVELCRRMRGTDPGLPVLLMTAYAGLDSWLDEARREGVLCVLPKPVPLARLLGLLGCARRDGVVGLFGFETALRAELAEALRSSGFTPVVAGTQAELPDAAAPLLAIVVDARASSRLERDVLLLLAEAFPGVPLFIVASRPQEAGSAVASGIFLGAGMQEQLIEALERLSDGRPGGATTASSAA